MSDQELKNDALSNEQYASSREDHAEGGQMTGYRKVGRTQRPRIQAQRTYNTERRTFQDDHDGDRPEG